MRLVLGGLATLLAGVSGMLGVLLLGLALLFGTSAESGPFVGPLWFVAVWYGMPLAATGLSVMAVREGQRLSRGATRPGWYLLAILGAAGSFCAWYLVGSL